MYFQDLFGHLPLQVAIKKFSEDSPALVELIKQHTPEELRAAAEVRAICTIAYEMHSLSHLFW